jgi:hypothetical protein
MPMVDEVSLGAVREFLRWSYPAASIIERRASDRDAWTFLVDLDGCQIRRLSVDSGFFATADWARRLNDQLRQALDDAGQRRVALSGKGLRVE